MSLFLDAQPADVRDQVATLLTRETVELSVLLHLDFAPQPLFLSNRSVAFVDHRWGRTWGAGGGLPVGLPDISGGDDQLAPFREYMLGLPTEWITAENWAASLVEEVSNVKAFRGRDCGLYGQFFDDVSGDPVGHPFAFDIGIMDRMKVSFQRGGAVVSLTAESFMARKGVPVYGMQTYFDQKRRHSTDEGLQFVTEAGQLITWTDW